MGGKEKGVDRLGLRSVTRTALRTLAKCQSPVLSLYVLLPSLLLMLSSASPRLRSAASSAPSAAV